MSTSLIETFKNNYRLELDNVNIKDMTHGGKQYSGKLLKLFNKDDEVIDIVTQNAIFEIRPVKMSLENNNVLLIDYVKDPYGIFVDEEVEGECFDKKGYYIDGYESTGLFGE